MKTIKYLSTLVLLFTFSMFFSQTHVSGNIENNTTWTIAGSPYVVDDDLTIANGVTLTIQPGVIVKFNDFWDDIWVNGTLNAIGTSSNRIVFTSFLDDAHGGDTNGDGNTTSAGPDQWSSIYYQKGSSGTLKYCTILYGGGEYSASVHIRDNNVLIDHCNISNSADRGIWIGDASPEISNCNLENNGSQGIWIEGFDGQKAFNLINNTFHNNQWAVFANLTDETNDIVLSGNTSTGTDANGFGRNGFGLVGTIAGKVSYTGQRNFPFIIWDDVIVKENAGLDISAGTTVKFNDFWDGIWIDGEMNAIGTETDSIYFTALADDSRGGDTNGDGTATSAGPNQWSTINYSDKGGKGELRYCFVGYGGGEYSANIHANNNGVTIDHCNISFSNERGIWIGNSSPDINNCTFDNNGTHAVWIEGFDSLKTFTFTNNTFHNNQW
ncbi:MAG TPA: right-handed parallel beta-helix repeat-containing protein, partial [Bacteroidetes bacterium]|nr:right-handed parallel beta-helix repeat-containing protein [Bacteroidota bacterium]